jgi:hypothetical protein
LEEGRRKREATLRRLSFEGHKTFIPTVVAVLSSPDILWSIAKDMVKKVNICNQILGKPEQQGYRRSFDIKASATPTTALRSWITHDLELAAD